MSTTIGGVFIGQKDIPIPDNTLEAFRIFEAANTYLGISTINGSEEMDLGVAGGVSIKIQASGQIQFHELNSFIRITGNIVVPNGQVFAGRNFLDNSDLTMMQITGSNNLIVGASNSVGSLFLDTGVAKSINLRPNGASISYIFDNTRFRIPVTTVEFNNSVLTPTFKVNTIGTNGVTGNEFLILGQICTGTTTTGGKVVVRPGTGTSVHGALEFQDAASNPITNIPATNERFRIVGDGGLRLESNDAVNVETIGGTKVLNTTGDPHFQKINGGVGDRNVDLPTEADNKGYFFMVTNNGATNNLSVRDTTPVTLEDLTPGDKAIFICDGTDWVSMGIM